MPSVLVFGGCDRERLTPASLEAVTAAAALAGDSGSLKGGLIGHRVQDAAKQFASSGLSELFVVDDSRLQHYLGDYQVAAAEAVIRAAGAETVVIPTDSDATEWAPRLAARLDAALVSGCLAAENRGDALRVKRAIAGGALHATYRTNRQLRILLLVSGTHRPASQVALCPVREISLPDVTSRVELVATIGDAAGQGPPLKTAKVVISGGVGVATPANWKLIDEAAQALGAAVGASRAAVEMGLAPSSRQVGFSGLKVNPELYMAVGISGALHHLAGIGGAKRVVAINKDPEAPIFKAAHLGVVGDLTEILPAFTRRVRELKQG
jgi:electron transfer flavoprotein alpha subunit